MKTLVDARRACCGCWPPFRPKFSTSIRSGSQASWRWPAISGVAIDRLLLTNGVDEAIHLLCETYLEPGDEALIVVPTFSLYEIYALATGAKVVTVQSGEGFAFPARDVLRAITPATKLICWPLPTIPRAPWHRVKNCWRSLHAAPDAALLMDEAYLGFSR